MATTPKTTAKPIVAKSADPVEAAAKLAASQPPVKSAPVKTTPVKATTAKTPPAKPPVVKTPVVAHSTAAQPATAPVMVPEVVVAAAPVEAPAPVQATAPVATPVPVQKPAPAPAIAAADITQAKEVTIMEATLKNAAEKTQTMFADMNERAKGAMEKSTKLFADMNEFNKGNVEALVESSKIAARGVETMGQDAADYTRKSFEGMTSMIKTLSSVKSPTEFMKLQSDYVRQQFDTMVAESSKTTEAVLKLAGEIAQPISNRVAVAVEKIKIAA